MYFSFGNARNFLKYLLIRAQAFKSEFRFHAAGFLLCSKTHLQATSIASFKWHLAVNETHILPFSSSGICASVSEAGVRQRAEREAGEER